MKYYLKVVAIDGDIRKTNHYRIDEPKFCQSLLYSANTQAWTFSEYELAIEDFNLKHILYGIYRLNSEDFDQVLNAFSYLIFD